VRTVRARPTVAMSIEGWRSTFAPEPPSSRTTEVELMDAGCPTTSVPVDEDGTALTTYADVRAALFNRSLAQHAQKRYEAGNILEGVS